jgi:hypothetical protein
MRGARSARLALSLAIVSVLAAACGKTDAPQAKGGPAAAAEREAAAKKARESAVFGDQLKAMDKAKETADAATKAAEDRAKKANQ